MVCFKLLQCFKGFQFVPKILLGPFFNTLFQIIGCFLENTDILRIFMSVTSFCCFFVFFVFIFCSCLFYCKKTLHKTNHAVYFAYLPCNVCCPYKHKLTTAFNLVLFFNLYFSVVIQKALVNRFFFFSFSRRDFQLNSS